MFLDKYKKQPNEIFIKQVDYSEWINTGEDLTGVTTTIELLNPETGDVAEPTLEVDTTTINNDIYQYYIRGGTDGKNYKVTFLANTTFLQAKEIEIEFKVRDT